MPSFTISVRAEAALVVVVLGVFVAILAPTLGEPLVERHPFRQTQTAFQARIFHEDGIDLAHPKVPVLGEPFEVPFEFPLLQAAASIVMDLGVQETVAIRVAGLVCFLATALLLYGLVRAVAGRVAAIGSLFAFVITPFAFLWSRASMIEYLATAGSVGLTWALVSRRETGRPLPGALALLAGLVGMLVKPTTAIFWVLPGLLYRPTRTPQTRRRWPVDPWVVAAVAIPIVSAVVWTRHADAVKAANLTTAFLTSENLSEWNLGTLEQRFDPETWDAIFSRIWKYILGLLVVLVAAAIVAMTRSRQWPFWLGIASAAVLPPLVLTNLYAVHDYYLAALTPALAALVGLGADFVWKALPRRPRTTFASIAVALVLLTASFAWSTSYWGGGYANVGDHETLALAREIESLTPTDEYVAVADDDWSPSLLYFAHRRGHMLRNEEFRYDLIHEQGYRYLFVKPPGDSDLGPLSRWRWLGALGPHTYAMADTLETLPRSKAIATSDLRAIEDRFGPRRGRNYGVRVPCGPPLRIAAGNRGTWLRLAPTNADAMITLSNNLVALPARPAVFAAPALAHGGWLTLACSGAPAVRVVEVVDADARS